MIRASFCPESILLCTLPCFGSLSCCSHRSFSYKTCAVGTVKPCRLSSNSSFVRFLCKKKSPVVRTPPDDTPSHIGNLGDALDTQRLVFHFFCVHFLMEVGYSQTELSSVKKKKKLSASCSCCGHGTSLNQ